MICHSYTVWEVHINGESPLYFKNEVDARDAAQGFIDNGNHYVMIEQKPVTLTVYESLGEYRKIHQKNVRVRALAKLTAEERAALGVE